MIASAIKAVADLILTLRKNRTDAKTVTFEKYIDPLFKTSKCVFDDYLDYYQCLRVKINGQDDLVSIRSFIDSRRMKHVSEREEIRGLLSCDHDALKFFTVGRFEDFLENKLNSIEQFEVSVLIMVGGNILESIHHFWHMKHDIYLIHELRHLIREQKFIPNEYGPQDIEQYEKRLREDLLSKTDIHVQTLQEKFRDVSQKYWILKRQLIDRDVFE